MESFCIIGSGEVIVTEDGIMAVFDYAHKDKTRQWVFESPIANNISDNICLNGRFRINDRWRYATSDEIEDLRLKCEMKGIKANFKKTLNCYKK